MGWTKQQLVLKAFGATGLVEHDGTDIVPEMLQDGLSSLDALMAQWDSQGFRLGYLASEDPTSGDLSQDSGLPDWAVRAVYMNLALELAGGLGREVSPRVAAIATQSLDALRSMFAAPTPYRGSSIPMGAGHKPWPGTGFSILDLTDEDEDDLDGGSDTVDSDLDFS